MGYLRRHLVEGDRILVLPREGLVFREIGNLLPNNRRQRRTCYALCHILYPVSAAHTSIFRMDSNSTSYSSRQPHHACAFGNRGLPPSKKPQQYSQRPRDTHSFTTVHASWHANATSGRVTCFPSRIPDQYTLPDRLQPEHCYRGTSLIRNRLLLGPYSSPVSRGLGWS